MYENFLNIIKTGDLTKIMDLYQRYKCDVDDVESILLPKLDMNASIEVIKNTPYGYAVCHNYVDICEWLLATFPNVRRNLDGVIEYHLIDDVCELGHLEMLKWLHINYPYFCNGDFHIDPYIAAVTNHHFEVADYLLKMFNREPIFRHTTRSIFEKMLKNPDKEILFYIFTKFSQSNKTCADLLKESYLGNLVITYR
jgi:hypothetical protein